MQGLQNNDSSKIDEFILLGVNVNEENVFKLYIIGFVDSNSNVDDNFPHNLTSCGFAGNAEQIENVEEYLNNVYYLKLFFGHCLLLFLILGSI